MLVALLGTLPAGDLMAQSRAERRRDDRGSVAAATMTSPGTLPPGKSVTVKIDATVDQVPIGTSELSAQGTVSGSGFADVLTDDPDVAGASDPTVTPADDPGIATCPLSIVPSSETVGNGGGTASLNVMTSGACPWTVTETSDPDGIGTLPGTVSGTGDGTVQITVVANGQKVAKTATYTATIDTTAITATFTINQDAADNTAPDAIDDAYAVVAGDALSVDAAAGVLANDTDLHDDPLTAALGTDVSNGTLDLMADGSFTYTPDPGFVGDDTFTYTANDGTDTSAPATVTISVTNAVPVATADSYSITAGEVLTVDAATGVLANDSDAEGDPLTATLATDVSNGMLDLDPDGSFTYTPDLGFSGTDEFTYTVSDGTDESAPAMVTITVGSCTFAITPTFAAYGRFAGTGTVQVDTQPGCEWTAESNATWLHVLAGAMGTGDGAVEYQVNRNDDASPRTGTITIAGETLTVDQGGADEEFGIAPVLVGFPGAGGTGQVAVGASAGAAWTAVSNATWIVITGGAAGTGDGTVSYEVAENEGGAPRTGTVMIAGERFTVQQAAGESSLEIWIGALWESLTQTNMSIGGRP